MAGKAMKHIKELAMIMIVAIIGFITLPLIKYQTKDITAENGYSSASAGLAGILPIVMVMAILGMCASLFVGGQIVVRYLKWESFGNRLKLAYAAKFGGENPAFNQEVDSHIKAMRSLSKGYTKSVDEDWLKRIASFVEVKYVIPEEERLSETEKTEMLEEESELEEDETEEDEEEKNLERVK